MFPPRLLGGQLLIGGQGAHGQLGEEQQVEQKVPGLSRVPFQVEGQGLEGSEAEAQGENKAAANKGQQFGQQQGA